MVDGGLFEVDGLLRVASCILPVCPHETDAAAGSLDWLAKTSFSAWICNRDVSAYAETPVQRCLCEIPTHY